GTSPAAFGAIATSLPPDPVIMAETLVHEFQHLKLCSLMDMMPLIQPGGERVYAPWRQDPRPAGGLLQGVYAHLGISRFWNVQQHVESEPDDILRAQVMYERWRPTIEMATDTLLESGCLTPTGIQFVSMVRDQGRSLDSGTVSAPARDIAAEVVFDHWLTWQLRHTAIDSAAVVDLAASYQRGESLNDQGLPESRIEEDSRKFESTIRSRLLNMRYLEPGRYRKFCLADVPGLSEADCLLVSGDARSAIDSYRDEIASATAPLPDAWVGLALAIHRGPPTPLQQVFATKLPLIFDMYAWLIGQEVWTDPLALAAWFA
ncbi:MAG TPA: HEXXH motif-containing putative peptide modification protein, partial [Chloroflexota bacterium]